MSELYKLLYVALVELDDMGRLKGMCHTSNWMQCKGVIERHEEWALDDDLQENRDNFRTSCIGYWFKIGDLKPRLRVVKKMIRKHRLKELREDKC